jgi:phosphoribosylformylglycinamidine synthase
MNEHRYRNVRVLIPTGFGLNCEDETEHAFRLLGAQVERAHWTDLFAGVHTKRLGDYHVISMVGGFAYGDHIGGGVVLAARIRAHLLDDLRRFLDQGGLMLGICNGFQTMVRLGILPGSNDGTPSLVATADLGPNDRLGYRDAWIRVAPDPRTRCVWLREVGTLDLPSRHGEGKFLVPDEATLDRLETHGQLALRYIDLHGNPTEAWPDNPSGSKRGVAGVSDVSGRCFGLMPHPDAFLHPWQHPDWRRHPNPDAIGAQGLRIFEAGLRSV